MPWALAIDFGTTNTTATVSVDGAPPLRVRLSSNSDAMPSAILVDGGVTRVGTSAVHARRVRPECFIEAPKTLLGQGTAHVAGEDYAVAELVGQVFGYVSKKAAAVAGSDVPDRVVLTHPQDWASKRRDALVAAWHASGVAAPQVELVSEPVAAASWLVSRPGVTLGDGARIAVLDYGGGTCDVSVLQWTGEQEQPWSELGSAGAPQVGGMAIDLAMLSWVREALHRRGEGDLEAALDDPAAIGALRTLLDEVRQAKEVLSEVDQADIPVALGAESTWVSITADEFEGVVAGEVAKVRALTERALSLAGVAGTDLDRLFLTGGSSLMRPVQAAMSEVLGRRPATLDDPKLVVALGAHLVDGARVIDSDDPGPSAGGPVPPGDHPASAEPPRASSTDHPEPALGAAEPGAVEEHDSAPAAAEPSPELVVEESSSRGRWQHPVVLVTGAAALVGIVIVAVLALGFGSTGEESQAGGGGTPTPAPSPTVTCSDGSVVSDADECPEPTPSPASYDPDQLALIKANAFESFDVLRRTEEWTCAEDGQSGEVPTALLQECDYQFADGTGGRGIAVVYIDDANAENVYRARDFVDEVAGDPPTKGTWTLNGEEQGTYWVYEPGEVSDFGEAVFFWDQAPSWFLNSSAADVETAKSTVFDEYIQMPNGADLRELDLSAQ